MGKGGEIVLPQVEVTEESIRDLLRSLSIPVNLKGYEYLVRAVRICSNSDTRNITCKKIYASIKDELSINLSVKSIETAIREAITKSAPFVQDEDFKRIFGANRVMVCRGREVPSNTTFIKGVSEYLTIHERRLKYETSDEQGRNKTSEQSS